MKNPEKNVNKDFMVLQTPFVIWAKTQKRLLKASKLMRYYETVSWDLTASSVKYNPAIKFFTNQW
eukprot:4758046-Ditylum_brightwellii.AAC.1